MASTSAISASTTDASSIPRVVASATGSMVLGGAGVAIAVSCIIAHLPVPSALIRPIVSVVRKPGANDRIAQSDNPIDPGRPWVRPRQAPSPMRG